MSGPPSLLLPATVLLGVLLGVLAPAPLSAQASRAALAPGLDGVLERPIAGRALSEAPWFTHTLAFNEGTPVQAAFDTRLHPELVGRSARLWVLSHRSREEWHRQRELVDARGGPQELLLRDGGRARNVVTLDPGSLSGQTGSTDVGVGYDVVLDLDRDGTLSAGDWIDGLGRQPGFCVVSDLTQPGPYTPLEELFNGGGTFEKLDVYWPAEVASLGRLPLVVVSHGNGHNYQWYDHIGNFLSSWGYVVVSHANNTGPGIGTASTTTLSNTDLFLTNLDVIAGGALREHVDSHQIVWIGHSRGGEGIVRAYNRLLAGAALATAYSAEDIRLLSSIAPTDFKRKSPDGVPFHLWTGGADRDVNGCADCNICQTFHLHERAEGMRLSISLHGVGHGDFHDGGGSSVASGPCLVGRTDTHAIMRGVLLPLLKFVLEGNEACKEYLWRQWEDLHPIGAPDANPCVVVDLQFQEGPRSDPLVVDDFQENPSTTLSSSGGRVLCSNDALVEGVYNDADNAFSATLSDPMNGMTLAGPGDDSRGLVLEWNQEDEWLLFELPGAPRDLTGYKSLSFRAAQATRDALTDAEQGDLTFEVRLWDARGRSGVLGIGAYGGGIEEPYQRGGCGSGLGWANEFETVRLPLGDFRAGATPADALDLRALVAVEFLFGPSHGSAEGRIGLDEIEWTRR